MEGDRTQAEFATTPELQVFKSRYALYVSTDLLWLNRHTWEQYI